MSINLYEPMKGFLRQAVGLGFTTDESWRLLGQTMATPMPARPAARK
jgi:hypothetical protein